MWVPGVRLLSRLMLSALTRAGRFCILKSGAVRLMDVPAGNRRGLSDYYPHLMPSVGFGKSSSRVYRCRSETKRYITSPRVAETLVRILRGKRKSCQLFLECNPGETLVAFIFLDVHFCRLCKNMASSFKQLIWPLLIITPQDISVAVCTLQTVLIKHALRFHHLPQRTFILPFRASSIDRSRMPGTQDV